MTYSKAKATHLAALSALGWAVKPDLKVPHATSPDGRTRLYFKSQAVYAAPDGGSLKVARSLHRDSRTTTTAQLVAHGVDVADWSREHAAN